MLRNAKHLRRRRTRARIHQHRPLKKFSLSARRHQLCKSFSRFILEQAKRGSSTVQDGSQGTPLRMTAQERSFTVPLDHAAQRLDQFLASHLPETSRARVQQLISQGKVLVDGNAPKPSLYLRGGEKIQICGEVERPPLRAIPEEIP